MEKKLSNELNDVIGEMKALYMTAIFDGNTMSYMDSGDLEKLVKLLALTDRMMNIGVKMLEQQEELMSKMDTALNTYLKQG